MPSTTAPWVFIMEKYSSSVPKMWLYRLMSPIF